MVHALALEPFGQIAGDVAGAVVGEQPRLVPDLGAVAARCGERQLQRVGDIAGPHVGAELPGDHVAAEVVQGEPMERQWSERHWRTLRQYQPPADDLQVGEVGLLTPGRRLWAISERDIWFGRVVLSRNSSLALITTKAGPVTRS